MRKLIILLFGLSLNLAAQPALVPEMPFVEVTGTSEMEIVPDIIEVTITLREYVEGRDKKDIDKQEQDLKKNLKELGIDLKDLTVVTSLADFQRVKILKKDVVNSRTYLLKLGTAEMVAKVYERLDKISVHDARVSRLDHTKIKEFQKENRIKAIVAAKEKATYLMNAIGKTAGDPLQVTEGENWVENAEQGMRSMNKRANYMMEMDAASDDEELSMRKIRIRSGFSVKFEIK